MSYAYLGFFEALQTVFKALIDNVVAPILTGILETVISMIGSLLHEMFGKLLLLAFTSLLRLIDFIASVFNIAAGITPVVFQNEEMSLLEALLNVEGIGMVFWLFTALAMVMTFLFTIFGVLRSMADSIFENKRPISQAIVQGIKSAVTFFLLPMLCLILLQFSNIVLQTINDIDYTDSTMHQNELTVTGTSVGDILFMAMMKDAVVYPEKIENDEAAKEVYLANINARYLTRQPGETSELYVYENFDQVLEDFDYTKPNYVIALIMAAAMLLMILATVITLIKRCFDIVLLYLVSPFFAASKAYDDGKMYKEWQEAFVARFFAGLGGLISMKLYLIVIPFIAGNRFEFVSNDYINGVMTTLFALGGMWATYKSNTLITQILDPDIASEEAERSAMVKGYVMKALTDS